MNPGAEAGGDAATGALPDSEPETGRATHPLPPARGDGTLSNPRSPIRELRAKDLRTSLRGGIRTARARRTTDDEDAVRIPLAFPLYREKRGKRGENPDRPAASERPSQYDRM